MQATTRWTATLLKVARVSYVVAAAVGLGVTVLALMVAVYFEIEMTRGPSLVPVPAVAQVGLQPVGTETVAGRLTPPTNVRVAITRPNIDAPLNSNDVLGYIQADTFNGLAAFPYDSDILGGADADLFDRANGGGRPAGRGAAIMATAKLIGLVNDAIRSGQAPREHDYALTIVVRDRYGFMSQPTATTFSLAYGVRPSAQDQPAPAPVNPQPSELERLARDIALISGPEGSANWRAEYGRARSEPGVCGTTADNQDFVAGYRKLFEFARARLDAARLAAFYDGVCDSWRDVVTRQTRELAAAEAARFAAINTNRDAEIRYQAEAAAAWVARNATLVVAAGCFGAFLMICFLLAFLAMEDHSNAMRIALETLSEERRGGQKSPAT